jgi:hypothetical protein
MAIRSFTPRSTTENEVNGDLELSWLLNEVKRARAENKLERQGRAATRRTVASHRQVLSALEAFAAALTSRRLPVPPSVSCELRMLRALCGTARRRKASES